MAGQKEERYSESAQSFAFLWVTKLVICMLIVFLRFYFEAQSLHQLFGGMGIIMVKL